jgi:hypothetical protein
MLIVETGEGLANAESLVDLAYLKAFASSRGTVFAKTDEQLEQDLRKVHDYLNNIEGLFKGCRTKTDQALAFPRNGVYIYGAYIPKTAVPIRIKQAVSQLVIEAQTSDLMPNTTDSRIVTQETVGPISTSYATIAGQISFPRVNAFFEPFFAHQGITTVRV